MAAAESRAGVHPSTVLRNLWLDVTQVLTAPSRGFYRLAEGGRWLPPLVLAGLCGLLSSGADPLKAVIVAALGGGWSAAWLAKAAALFLVLFPLYYAGSVAVFAAVGTAVTGRQTGIGWRQAFRRCWSVLGWVGLPVLVLTLAVTGLILTTLKPVFLAAVTAPAPGAAPSFFYSPPIVIGAALVVWVALLFLVAVRQAFAASTGQALAIIILAGVIFGGLVHTPLVRCVSAGFADTYQVLGRGPAKATVSLLAYRFPSRKSPVRGDLVAYGPPGPERKPAFVLHTPFGFPAVLIGRYDEVYFGRVVGLPGDTVAVRGGVLFRNGAPAEEPYLDGLEPALARPPELDLPETKVSPGFLLVLPDNRSVLPRLPRDAGPLVAADRLRGKVVAVMSAGATDTDAATVPPTGGS